MSILRKYLNDNERCTYTATLFGVYFPLQLEPFIFDMAGTLSCDYHGGFWNMYKLSNHGFYMAPESDSPFHVSCMNGYEGSQSADAFGKTVCLYAYSQMSFSDNPKLSETCADQYHLLREYLFEHTEVGGILGAID
jgi:hypothetical protein